MNQIKTLLSLAAIFLLPLPALADQQTIQLSVEGMTCQSCPYQVRSALKRVEGVFSASASLETRAAVVIFDDAVTDISTLTQATADAGFPSTLRP